MRLGLRKRRREEYQEKEMTVDGWERKNERE
jgi:hypothetical protein